MDIYGFKKKQQQLGSRFKFQHHPRSHCKYNNCRCIVKSGFGKVFQIFIFFKVIYKSYRQVLTLVENSSLLLKLRIFNKPRLATLYKHSTQRITVQRTGFILIGETAISMTLNRRVFTKRRSPLKHACKFHFRLRLSFSSCCNSWYGIDITVVS